MKSLLLTLLLLVSAPCLANGTQPHRRNSGLNAHRAHPSHQSYRSHSVYSAYLHVSPYSVYDYYSPYRIQSPYLDGWRSRSYTPYRWNRGRQIYRQYSPNPRYRNSHLCPEFKPGLIIKNPYYTPRPGR